MQAKCDAYLNPDAPCSRCRKVGATCVISDPFKREHKRKSVSAIPSLIHTPAYIKSRRLSQLEHEAEELRKRLNGNSSSRQGNKIVSPIGVVNGRTDSSHTPQSLRSSSTTATSPIQSTDLLAIHQQSLPINARPAPVVLQTITPPAGSDGPTQARRLKEVTVDAEEIDDIFQMSDCQ